MKRDMGLTVDNIGTCLVDQGVRSKSRRVTEAAQKLNLMMRLPSELLMNILLRLPVGDIMRCKCVCKELLDLVMAPEFIKPHLSRAVPGLVVFEMETQIKPYKVVEFVENLDLSSDEYPCRCRVVLNFKLPFRELPVHSSANGLLILYRRSFHEVDLILCIYICNPITREYIRVPCPEHRASHGLRFKGDIIGFGVSRISGQYKVVKIYMEYTATWNFDIFECQVYTIGTGSWRRIASSSRLHYETNAMPAVLNGNLHWMAFDPKSRTACISCFDLETEVFTTTFSTPNFYPFSCKHVAVLGNCLCLSGNGADEESTGGYETGIWLMKDYGDDKSWTKDFVIRGGSYYFDCRRLRVFKVFEDGGILMEWGPLSYYSNRTKTTRNIGVFEDLVSAAIYTPSFVPLKTFAMENVITY